MKSVRTNLPLVNLRPGELYVAKEPTIIATLLGSCVSVCLFCPSRKIGAMCHGVMPFQDNTLAAESFRFVDSSVAYMVEVLAKGKDGRRARLEAKLFGGADVLDINSQKRRSVPTIGRQNIEAARASLAKHKVPIAAEKVGGLSGCKLFFYSHTGEVLLKRLPRFSGNAHGKN